MSKAVKIPAPTIKRLAFYSRPLEELLESGPPVISSEGLADLCGVQPAQVRKDLAYFGEFGVRGVGYNVRELLHEIKHILSTDRRMPLCIVGVGNLGTSLIENENFKKRGYIFEAAFDSDPEKQGQKLSCGLVIEPNSRIKEVCQEKRIEIGVIATPPQVAQRVCRLLVDAGVGGILNFSPIQVRSTAEVKIENVDFTVKLENLAYHLHRLYESGT
ncbi:MAG: redox-sensing transcriptional repressor Rex [Deltaproteobacteria bacterium]|jgi:redox-sensing transcriptional repressor